MKARILPSAIATILCFGSAAGFAEDALRKGLDLTFTGKPHVEKPVPVAESRAPLPVPRDRLRLCTYNIEHFVDGHDDWVSKSPAQAKRQAKHAAQLIGRIHPDVLVIQEIENKKVVQRLNTSMESAFPVAYITDFGSDRDRAVSQNIAMLSRVAVKGVRELDFEGLSGAGRPPRGVLSFFVELGDGHRLLVYAVHLKANVGKRSENYSKRWNALRIIRADWENLRRKYPKYTWEAVVVGDMNVDPESRDFGDDPTFQPLIDWVDLWLGRPIEERTTIPPRQGGSGRKYPPQGFDRFILSKDLSREPWVGNIPTIVKAGIDTENAETEPGITAAHVSDHYPVYMDIRRSSGRGQTGGRQGGKGLLDEAAKSAP